MDAPKHSLSPEVGFSHLKYLEPKVSIIPIIEMKLFSLIIRDIDMSWLVNKENDSFIHSIYLVKYKESHGISPKGKVVN